MDGLGLYAPNTTGSEVNVSHAIIDIQPSIDENSSLSPNLNHPLAG